MALVLGLTLLLIPGPATQTPPLPAVRQTAQQGTTASPPKQRTDSSSTLASIPSGTTEFSERGGLAIVMDDLGEDPHAVRELLNLRLPLTFAVWPHARFAAQTAEAAYAAGHEVIIHQPMQARDPKMNRGKNTLVVGMPREAMENILRESLRRVPHAAGLNNHMGSRFTSERRDVRTLCELPALAGLFVLDSVTHPDSVLYEEAYKAGLPSVRRDLFLDARPGREYAATQLRKATRLALSGKRVVAIGHPRRETFAAIQAWNANREPELRMIRLRDCLRSDDIPVAPNMPDATQKAPSARADERALPMNMP